MAKELDSNEVIATARARRQVAPELAKQVKRRLRKRAAPNIHAVDNETIPQSRLQEGADLTTVVTDDDERNWNRSSKLPAVPNPHGKTAKWVRIDGSQRGDFENLTRHLSEGWMIAKKSEFPTVALPTTTIGNFGNALGNAKTILCTLTLRQKAQRDRWFNGRRDQATQGVSTAIDGQSHRLMPLVENVADSRLARNNPTNAPRSVRRGKQIAVQAD